MLKMLKKIKLYLDKILKIFMKQKILMLLSVLSIIIVAGLVYYFKPYNYIIENFTISSENAGLKQTTYTGYYNDDISFFENNDVLSDDGNVSKIAMSTTPELISYMWSGYIIVDEDDTYTFELTSDDSSHLYIEDDLVVDNGKADTTVVKTGTKPLLANVAYKVKIYYGNAGGPGNMTLKWKNTITQPEYSTDLSTKFSSVDVIAEEEQRAITEAEEAAKEAAEKELADKIKSEINADLDSKLTKEKEEADAAAAKTKKIWIIVLSVLGGVLFLGGITFFFYKKNPEAFQRIRQYRPQFRRPNFLRRSSPPMA